MADLDPLPAEPTSEGEARQVLAATYRLVAHFGWDDLIYTHLSHRVPGVTDEYLINPYGMLFEEVRASDLVRVALDGEIRSETHLPLNRAGYTIHSAIHGARPDAHCVLHVHEDHGVAVSTLRDGLLPLSQHALSVVGDVAYHDYEGIALELDERERLVGDLGDRGLMILRNHGLLTVGRSACDAFLRLHWLVRACRIQLLAQAAGAPLGLGDDALVARVGAQARPLFEGGRGRHAWPALVRLADRLDPGYRD